MGRDCRYEGNKERERRNKIARNTIDVERTERPGRKKLASQHSKTFSLFLLPRTRSKKKKKRHRHQTEDAAEVAKGALKKLGLGALTAVEKVLGGGEKSSPSTRQQQRPRPGDEGDGDSFWGPTSRPPSSSSSSSSPGRGYERGGGPLAGSPGGVGGGLLGSLVGGVLGKAVQGAFSAIAEQSREAGALAEAALDAANGDAGVRDEFGGQLRRAGGTGFGSMAQSSSTVVVNGRARRSTSVSFPVAGPRGGGFLEAKSTGGDGEGGEEVVVRVRSQRGRMITVSGSGGSGGGGSGGGGGVRGSGDVIDVDFREV